MEKIRLSKNDWEYDPSKSLGLPGNSGAVYLGYDKDGCEVAIKELHIFNSRSAHREIEVAERLVGRKHSYVVPVLDCGEDIASGGYFIVLAKAKGSLDDLLTVNGRLDEKESIEILYSIASGLVELKDLNHCDLKPENVLFQNGRWKIADFGVAQFVRESPSKVLKGYISPHYAAPEHWYGERPTEKTDVYAIGCIAYACLTGDPPFIGNDLFDLRYQHLHAKQERLSRVSHSLESLISMTLRKSQVVRPNLLYVRDKLHDIGLEEEMMIARGLTDASKDVVKSRANLG